MTQDLTDVISRGIPAHERRALKAWLATLYPYQRRWIGEPNRIAISIKARQIGGSHTSAAWAAMQACFTGESVSVVSIGEREAAEVIDKAQRHASVLLGLGSRWARTHVASGVVHFVSGGRVTALPASSGGRGYSGHVLLDEFAYHGSNASRVWDAASASTMHGYALRVVSTPSGVGTVFHGLVTGAKRYGYALHRVTLEDAIADGLKIDREHCKRMARGDDRLYAQLFECSFADGGEQYLRTDDVVGSVRSADDLIASGPCYAGLDVGLENDLSVLTIVQQDVHTNEIVVREIVPMRRTQWSEQQSAVHRSLARWRWHKIAIDATGLGEVPAQLLSETIGPSRVESVRFSPQTKETIASTLYQAFADNMITIPNDPELIHDLCALQRIVAVNGSIRYDAPRTEQGHADRAWSLGLALHACANRVTARIVSGDAYA